MITFSLNGHRSSLDLDPDMPLLLALRDHLGLTGTRIGCLEGACGACTVLVDGAPQRACLLPLGAVAGSAVTTIEGLAGPLAERLRAAWRKHQVPQCGYCQSGMLMHAAGLMPSLQGADEKTVREVMGAVLCRCGTAQRVVAAVHEVASR